MISELNGISTGSQTHDLDRITAALGPVAGLAYSPPHDYPMSVPAFRINSRAERERPEVEQLRLYTHIPFCNYGCSYCYFAKRVGSNREQMERYVKALKRELEWVRPGTPLSQLFVGGGTPTVLPADLLDEVLSAIFDRTTHDSGIVHTVETSPESISEEHINVLHKNRIARVSMGIQSLDKQVLDAVNRRHTIEEALSACRLLVESGFIVNIDLMYGLPGQTHESFRHDLELIASQGVQSATFYNLRINERTPVTRTLDEEKRLDLASLIHWRAFVRDAAENIGYTQTRWHTFKRLDSIASRHERAPHFANDGTGYQLGIGMGARSQLGYKLYRNTPHINAYLKRIESGQSPVEDIIPLSVEDRKTQFVARSIGDGKPLDIAEYENTFDRSIHDDFGESIRRLHENGIIESDTERLYLTDTGKLVYDLVTVSFYPQSALVWLKDKEQANLGRMKVAISD